MIKPRKLHLGDSIKMLRTMAGLTQAQLGDKIGKTRGLLSIIEKRGKVNYYTLKAISEALGTTVEFIEGYQKGLTPPVKNMVNEKSNDYIPLNISSLLREIELLKQVIEQQNKIILLMESERKDNKIKHTRKKPR